MSETLDEQSRIDLVKYRIERADETLQEAGLLAKEGYYNAAFNRLYYACFCAGTACKKWHLHFITCRGKDDARTALCVQRCAGKGTWQDLQPPV